jgi:lysophospholipase L1-like esterase
VTGFRVHLISLFAAIAAALASAPASAVTRAAPETQWVGSWASAQMLVDQKDALAAEQKDVTLRQLVRTSIGGARVRVRISNAMGTSPLTISSVSVAHAVAPGSSRIDASTNHSVTFAGERPVTIPAGAEYVSDPIEMRVPALTTLAVSMHFSELPKLQTGHPGSRATSFFVVGDQLGAAEIRNAGKVDHWFFLSGVDVEPAHPSTAIAILGDSITDGHGVVSNTDTRWTDILAQRLNSSVATRSLSVLNLGIGGNCIANACLGPNAAARFQRDVLARSGVRYLFILEGVNDLGMLTRDAPATAEAHRALVHQMTGALAQIVAQARERGIKVIGATIMPYGGSGYYHPDAANEADRRAVNNWIRAPGHVTAVVDFDALMRDPAQPDRLRREFDSGDGLHPSAAGYRLMGEAVPLSLFTIGARR